MPPSPASSTGAYGSPLTGIDGADYAVDVNQNLADEPRAGQDKTGDLEQVIARIHGRGMHLVLARQLRGGQP